MTTPDPTAAERSRRYYARKTGKLDPVSPCCCCGRATYSPRDGLCRACWLKTPDGKADTLRRTKATRDRQRAKAIRDRLAAQR